MDINERFRIVYWISIDEKDNVDIDSSYEQHYLFDKTGIFQLHYNVN